MCKDSATAMPAAQPQRSSDDDLMLLSSDIEMSPVTAEGHVNEAFAANAIDDIITWSAKLEGHSTERVPRPSVKQRPTTRWSKSGLWIRNTDVITPSPKALQYVTKAIQPQHGDSVSRIIPYPGSGPRSGSPPKPQRFFLVPKAIRP